MTPLANHRRVLRPTLAALAVAAALFAFAGRPLAAADAPVLVIYPFGGNADAASRAGADLAAKIADEITALGGVKVVRGSADTPPGDRRAAAQAAGADFFLTGQVASAPIGSSLLVIEQVVRSRTGLSVWAHNFSITGAGGAAGEGATIRTLLLEATQAAAPGPDAATPAPAATAPSVATILGADVPATPRPRATAAYAVVPFDGNDTPSAGAFAARAIAEGFRHRGASADVADLPAGGVPAAGVATGAEPICASMQAAYVISGTLTTTRVEHLNAPPTSTVALLVQRYDCKQHAAGAKTQAAQATGGIWTDAMRGAADGIVNAVLGPPPS